MGDAIIRADGMRTGTVVQCFGPFELDPASGRLFQGQTRVRLSDPQAAILLRLVANAGQVVSKESLVGSGWGSRPQPSMSGLLDCANAMVPQDGNANADSTP